MVIGNTWTKAFFKLASQDTAELISKLIGTEKSSTLTVAYSGGVGVQSSADIGSTKGASDSSALSVTEKEEEVAKISEDVLKGLGKGECVITYGGSRVYHNMIPRVSFSQKFKEEVGDFALNIPLNLNPISKEASLSLFSRVNEWVT
jgi:hypothetical protein